MLFAQENELHMKATTMAARMISEIRVDNPFEVGEDVPLRRTFVSNERHPQVTPEDLSERWGIGLTNARNIIRVTTQEGA